MSISLNEIGYSVANALGKPNDFFLRQTIMLDAIGIRAMLIRQDLSRNTLSKLFLQSLGAVPIKCVDASECPDVPTGTYLLRTVTKVPNPVRTKDDSTFYFVGTPDRSKSFTETTVIGMDLTSHDRYTSKDTKYFYLGGYIYIFNPRSGARTNFMAMFLSHSQTGFSRVHQTFSLYQANTQIGGFIITANGNATQIKGATGSGFIKTYGLL